MLIDYPLIENYKRVCKKVTVMQESYYNYWQDSEIDEQIWYFNALTEMDLMFCHNDVDLKYYRGLTGLKTELLPSVMITDGIKVHNDRSGVVIGGNLVRDYGGFDSYMVGLEISNDITAPTTGRIKEQERGMDINHLPWLIWKDWMDNLSKYKVGVQLGTAAAGTFNLNCSYLGIPCIGYSNLNTQRILHPSTTVELGDVESAKKIARRLNEDTDFYNDCSSETKMMYDKYYSEDKFKKYMNEILEKLNENN
jgi:hypothetical protein